MEGQEQLLTGMLIVNWIPAEVAAIGNVLYSRWLYIIPLGTKGADREKTIFFNFVVFWMEIEAIHVLKFINWMQDDSFNRIIKRNWKAFISY